MRIDNESFTRANEDFSKSARFTIEVSFDAANTDLYYLTSHPDSATPESVTIIGNVISGISATSQHVKPETAVASIGKISFKVVDLGNAIRDMLASELAFGNSLKYKRIRIYMGYENSNWDDYVLVQTQIVENINYKDGYYDFLCSDVQRLERNDIFDLKETSLANSITESATLIEVFNTAEFIPVQHSDKWSEAPSLSVVYLRIEDEVIRCQVLDEVSFTVVDELGVESVSGRGVLQTKAVEHTIDINASADRRTKVQEFVYLEMPAPKLAYAILTGYMIDQIAPSGLDEPDTYYNTVNADTPVFYMRLGEDPATGTASEDNNNYDGTYFNTISAASLIARDTVNKAVKFNGTDAYVSVPNTVDTLINNVDFTIEAHIKLDTTTSVEILTRGQVNNGGLEYGFRAYAADSGLVLYYCIGNAVLSRAIITAPTTLDDGESHHVVMTRDASTGIVEGFVDGVSIGTDTTEIGAIAYNGTYDEGFSLGANRRNLNNNWSDGTLDDVLIYTGILTPTQIAEHYKASSFSITQYSQTLPAHWNLGIDPDYVRIDDFINIGNDLWDTADDSIGTVLWFEGEEKQDGKKFLEQQVFLPMSCFSPVYADGAVGLKRMTYVISDAPYVAELNNDNIVSYGILKHDMSSVANRFVFQWAYHWFKERYNRTNVLVDTFSHAVEGYAKIKTIKFRGIVGQIHTAETIGDIFDGLRDRFTSPPLKLQVQTLFSENDIQVGDIVNVDLPSLQDYTAGAPLNRSFEVQRVGVDWIRGAVNLDLFGSTAKSVSRSEVGSSVVYSLNDAFYSSCGNDLKTYVGGGYDAGLHYSANHITADTTLTGGVDGTDCANVFYHVGDLTIDAGVTLTIKDNVQLRIMGYLTVNGIIDGKAQSTSAEGTRGYVSNARAQGFVYIDTSNSSNLVNCTLENVSSRSQPTIEGYHDAADKRDLVYDPTTETLHGLPVDLRGSRGTRGGDVNFWWGGREMCISWSPSWVCLETAYYQDMTTARDYWALLGHTGTEGLAGLGGDAGLAGAGLTLISRGHGFGQNGLIDLSGGDGGDHSGYGLYNFQYGNAFFGGYGAPGGGGAFYSIVDGGSSIPSIDTHNFISKTGSARYAPNIMPPDSDLVDVPTTPYGYNGAQYYVSQVCPYGGTSQHLGIVGVDNSESSIRIQYVPTVGVVEPELNFIPPPTNLVLTSGTDEILLLADGTIIPRIKVSFTPAVHPDINGYEVEYKQNTSSVWISATNILGSSSYVGYIDNIVSGTEYDVRIRSAGALETSEWLILENYLALGKTEPPSNVTSFTATMSNGNVAFSWSSITDVDLSEYEIRYAPVGGTFETGSLVGKASANSTSLITDAVPDGTWDFFIKAIDTSNNYSLTAASASLVVSTDAFNVYTSDSEAPLWGGTLTDMTRTVDGKLIPKSNQLMSNYNTWAEFDSANPDPVALAYYEIALPVNLTFSSVIKIWSFITSELMPGETTSVSPVSLEISTSDDDISYSAWMAWAAGTTPAQYVKYRIKIDTSIGIPAILDMVNYVDALVKNQSGQEVVGATGTTITFPERHHQVPAVNVQAQGATPLTAMKSNITETGFDVHVFDSGGVEVGGTVDWDSSGV